MSAEPSAFGIIRQTSCKTLSDFDTDTGVLSVQGLPSDTLISNIHVLLFGEVGNVVQFNRVSDDLRQVPNKTLAALGFFQFGDSIIIVSETLTEGADSGMRALANMAPWIWQLRRKDFTSCAISEGAGRAFQVERCPRVGSPASREHEGKSTTCAKPSGQHLRPCATYMIGTT